MRTRKRAAHLSTEGGWNSCDTPWAPLQIKTIAEENFKDRGEYAGHPSRPEHVKNRAPAVWLAAGTFKTHIHLRSLSGVGQWHHCEAAEEEGISWDLITPGFGIWFSGWFQNVMLDEGSRGCSHCCSQVSASGVPLEPATAPAQAKQRVSPIDRGEKKHTAPPCQQQPASDWNATTAFSTH